MPDTQEPLTAREAYRAIHKLTGFQQVVLGMVALGELRDNVRTYGSTCQALKRAGLLALDTVMVSRSPRKAVSRWMLPPNVREAWLLWKDA